MKVGELFKEQEDLDDYIMANLKTKGVVVEDKQQLLAYRLLALATEVGELSEANKNDKLMEASDVFHFVMSVGNVVQVDIPYKDVEFKMVYELLKFKTTNWLEALEKFIIKFSMVANASRSFKYWKTSNKEPIMDYLNIEYANMYVAFIHLGHALGFTAKEMESAYLEKNKINYERQQNGY
ncbi:MAG TPA: dUTP diphosphatase [Clostridiaceae bacterium]